MSAHPAEPLDLIRVSFVALLAIGQAVMAFWPQFRGWPHTTASRSADLSTPVVPVGWAFAIWGPIFLACLAFAVWQALPSNLAEPLLRSMGWLAAAAFAVNTLWEYRVPRYGMGWSSVVILLVELALLLAAVAVILGAGTLSPAQTWLAAAPFLLFAGWASAAAFVNLSSTAKGAGFDPLRIGETGNALVLVAAASAAGAVGAWLTGSWLYAGAIAWALFGMAVANRGTPTTRLVATASAVGAVLVLASGILSPAHPWLLV